MAGERHRTLGLQGGIYRPLSDADEKKIADAAMEILGKSGMAVYSRTAFDALVAAGADGDADQKIVRFPRGMVEDAVDSSPSSVTLYSRDGKTDVVLEGSKVHYGTGGTALYVLDPKTKERRQAVIDDVILNARLVENLENIHLHTINVFPHDITVKDDIDVNRFFHSLNHTNKHVMGGIYSMDGCKKLVAMLEIIAGSPEQLREKPFASFITLMISPFKIDDVYGEMSCYLAGENLPVVVPTEPICGTTSPVTLAGNVLVHITETIAGIAMLQAVHRGAPGICGSVGSIPDLMTMHHLGGPIERGIINAAVSQMAQYFKIPYYSTAGASDSKSMDAQAGWESGMTNLLVAMSGANYIHDSAGLLEADLSISYEKLVVDNEILGMCQRVLRGIEVNDDTLAMDMLLEKRPGCDYLVEPHTLAYMRDEFFMPRLANRDKRETMKEDDDAVARARQFVAEIRSTAPEGLIDKAVRTQILDHYPEIHTS